MTISSSGGTTPYSFTVTPALATRYRVKLIHSGSVAAKSAVQDLYVVAGTQVSGAHQCQRPVCTQTIHLHVFVPPSALKREMSKRTYPYFGLKVSRSGNPPAPKWLYLNAGHARVSKVRRVSAREYQLSIRYSFTIGKRSYNWLWEACTKDAVTKDGMGLPNFHGCGLTRVDPTWTYLG